MTLQPAPLAQRSLYAAEVKHHVLALREALVRHDENLKAHQLLSEAVPYFLLEDPDIVRAREDQREMVAHILEPDAYGEYYASNVHEVAFEQQYGIEPQDAHSHIPRVRFLQEGLEAQIKRQRIAAVDLRVLDLSANDGWMAQNLGELGYRTDCVDLNPSCCERAKERREKGARIGEVICADLHEVHKSLSDEYDAAIAFETVEHVPDPDRMIDTMVLRLCKPGGRLYVSTPHEAVEQGNLPDWNHVEPKGHVRVFREKDFRELLERFGSVERFELGADGVMCAEIAPG